MLLKIYSIRHDNKCFYNQLNNYNETLGIYLYFKVIDMYCICIKLQYILRNNFF